MITQFDEYVTERSLGTLAAQIEVRVDVESTQHADERQIGRQITDDDVVEVVKRAVPKVARLMVLDKLDVGDAIHVRRDADGLNVICTFEGGSMPLTLNVITVMYKDRFKPKTGTHTVKIK